MTTTQVEFTETELLADHVIEEPLVAEGVLCHGGFTDDGTYVSPRTLNRWPAIGSWEAQRRNRSGHDPIDIPLETWPESFPNVDQTRFLIGQGAPESTISALTRIGTVEGFGGILRMLPVPDFSRCFLEDVRGTATDHIGRGLFEAHARDEAGFEDVAGHDQMWFVARDIAFEHPVTEDQTAVMLNRMGIPSAPGPQGPVATGPSRPPVAERWLPATIPGDLETVVRRMVGLLLIEISAFHGFIWAEAILGDKDLVAGDGAGGTLVSYIRQDETPHVAWLKTALSEMRDFTWVGTDGSRHQGEKMISTVMDRALFESVNLRRPEQLTMLVREVEVSLAGRSDAADVMAEMLSLGSVHQRPDGTWADRSDHRSPLPN